MASALLQSMQSSLVGEIPKFKHLDEQYKCIICKGVLRVPMVTMCGHRMCKECALNYVEQKGGGPTKCPVNQDDCENFTIGELMPDIGVWRDLQRLSVYCRYAEHGCKELVPWSKLKDHIENCEFAQEDCVNKGFGCKARVSKIRMKEHIQNECRFRTKQCPHCETRIPERLMEEHLHNSCPMMSIICPFKCGEQSIQRKDLDEHKKVCRAKPKDCKYKTIGCQFMGTEEEVRRHESQDSSMHLDIVLNKVLSVDANQAELSQHVQKLQEEIKNTGARNAPAAPAAAGSTTNTAAAAPNLPQFEAVQKKCEVIEKKQERQEGSLKNMQKMVAGISDRVEGYSSLGSMQREMSSLRDNLRTVETSIKNSKTSDEQKQQYTQLERTLSMCNMRLQDMDLRLQCVETASYDGVLIWKIRDYKRRKEEAKNGRTMSLYSQPFYTSRYGYKACARIYLNGDGMGKNTHMSLFFVILRGDFDALLPWPFRQKVTMTLIDQVAGKKNIVDSFRADPTSNSFKRPTSDMNIASGCPLFAAQSIVEALPFLKDDCIYLKMHVDTKDLRDASYDIKSGSYDIKSGSNS